MARHVVVEFDDNEAADKFIAKFAGKTSTRVVGLFALPVKFCMCPTPTGYIKDEVVRGERFGWWVHVVCKRPILGTHQAENLLPIQDVPLTDRVYMSRVSSLSTFQLLTSKAARHPNLSTAP